MNCPLKSGRAEPGGGNDLFVARSARTLSPETEAALEQHLMFCEDCRRVAATQDRVWSALDIWEPVSASPAFDQSLYAKIAAEGRDPWWRRALQAGFPMAWSWKPAMPVAAACVALLAAFLFRSASTEQQAQLIGQPRVDIEQVERALDDMDMLSKLGLASEPPQIQGSRPAAI